MAANRRGRGVKNANSTTFIANIDTAVVVYTSFMTILLVHLIPSSNASLFSHPTKTVIVTNNYTNYLSVRCYSFDATLRVKHLKPSEQFSFLVKPKAIFPSATMYNCSTNMGVFVAYKYDYECAEDNWKKCEWRFDLNQTYHFNPKVRQWLSFDYNPNYESLYRGGVVKGRFIN